MTHEIEDDAGTGPLPVITPRQWPVRIRRVVRDKPCPSISHRPQATISYQLACELDRGSVPIVESHRGNESLGLCCLSDLAGLPRVSPHRLLNPERLSHLRSGKSDIAMQEIWRADGDDIYLGISDEIVVVLNRGAESQPVHCLPSVFRYHIATRNQSDAYVNLWKLFGKCFVRTSVQPPHPSQRNHADTNGSSLLHHYPHESRQLP